MLLFQLEQLETLAVYRVIWAWYIFRVAILVLIQCPQTSDRRVHIIAPTSREKSERAQKLAYAELLGRPCPVFSAASPLGILHRVLQCIVLARLPHCPGKLDTAVSS